MLKGNKGEWSELYVLISLLADGKLHQSDIDLNKDEKNVYEVVKGYKSEKDYSLSFDRKKGVVEVYKIEDSSKELIRTLSFENFKELSEKLYSGIVSGKGRSFRILEAEEELTSLKIQKLKEKSDEKADIRLKIYDYRLAKETDLGFSIKSLIGGNSTLFNAGNGTNFIFNVTGENLIDIKEFNQNTYTSPVREARLTYRLKELEKLNAKVKYHGTQSCQLWRNLKMIDGDLPEIISYALYLRYFHSNSSLKEIADLLEAEDPLNYYCGKESVQRLYEYKLKRFLTECAMGMTAETAWLGDYNKFGGVIVAKEDGDIVAFHIYDFNLFRQYLMNNTKFEQASTGENPEIPGTPKATGKKYHYGWLYEESNETKIKINLQIRFK